MYTYATKQMYTFYKTQANKTLWLYTFKTRRANTITGLIGVTNHFRHLKRKQHTCQRNRPPHKEELLEICKPPQPIKDSTIDIYVSVHLFIGIRQESQEKIKFKCSRCPYMSQFYRGLPQFCKVFSRAACTDEAYYKPGASPVLATCPQITPPIAMYEHPNDQASLYTCHSFAKFQLGTIIAHYFDVAQDVSGAVSGAAAPMRFLHLCAAPAIRIGTEEKTQIVALFTRFLGQMRQNRVNIADISPVYGEPLGYFRMLQIHCRFSSG